MKNIIILLVFPIVITLNHLGNWPNHQISKNELGNPFIKMKCGLYINKLGDIGLCVLDKSQDKPTKRYLTYVYNADTINNIDGGLKELKYVVDTLTFRFLNEVYYKDKNHIYIFHPMVDGGTIEISWHVNVNSFKVLNNGLYAIDNKSAYYRGNNIIGADVKSFGVFTSNKLSRYAYDKNNFYFGNEMLLLSEVKRLGLDKIKK